MKGLKVVLWILAIVCLLCFLGVISPWTITSKISSFWGYDIAEFQGPLKYAVRAGFGACGLIGIFFLMLAFNPLKYGGMLSLAGFGLLLLGLICLVLGIYYTFSYLVWLIDILFFFIFGILIIYFKGKAAQPVETKAESA